MIICSMPRCGATKICLDLEIKTGLKFVGELHPLHITDKRKADVHETRYQPSISADEFSDYLRNNSKYIVLVNRACFYLLPQCDVLILRKNMLNSFLSGANFLLKMYPNMKANVIIHEIRNTITEYVGVKSYIDKYSLNIIWYEDYFGIEDTDTNILDNHLHGQKIKEEIVKTYYQLIGET